LNAYFPIRDNLDLDSNLTEKSDLHSDKHHSAKNSIDEGKMISTEPAPLNASFSIRDNLDLD
jgi:hypothetical protein